MQHHKIEADSLREGHEIATKFVKREQNGQPVLVPSKFAKVQSVAACAGKWRTHVHVKVDGAAVPWCYDGRETVTVKGSAPSVVEGLASVAGAA